MVGIAPAALPKLARQYFGGLAHNHTVLSNHKGHHESDLSIDRFVRTLIEARLAGRPEAPLRYLMLNEHPSDPARPRKLGALSLRGRRLLRQRRRPVVQRVPLLYGLEVSLLPGGRTDLTPRLSDHCALVIGSRHALPPREERDPAVVQAILEAACQNPQVEVLGHPPRFIEDLDRIDWPAIFALAAATGTAIEVNLNVYPGTNGSPMQQTFWRRWLRQLARSGVDVFIGTDIHNQYQLDEFILQWRSLERPASHRENHLAAFITELAESGLKPEQTVTADYERFTTWLQIDKLGRASLH
jgi:histidinol phosphatase-like PHP family hydrolase